MTVIAARRPQEAVYKIPTLKEYFMDLEYILGVISDGPAKSFAYRRIKYLESRWNLYCLLNEYQELAEMKVSDECLPVHLRYRLTPTPAASTTSVCHNQVLRSPV